MRLNKLAMFFLLAFAATAVAAEARKPAPGEARKHPLELNANRSWQVKYHQEQGGILALQLVVSWVDPTVVDGKRAIALKLIKYTSIQDKAPGATDQAYVASNWGGTEKMISLLGTVDDKREEGNFKRLPMRFTAQGSYTDAGQQRKVVVSGFVIRNKTKKGGAAADKDVLVGIRVRDTLAELVPVPQAVATAFALAADSSDPCEGVSAEDILEEGDYVDPTTLEFSYEPYYSLP